MSFATSYQARKRQAAASRDASPEAARWRAANLRALERANSERPSYSAADLAANFESYAAAFEDRVAELRNEYLTTSEGS